jgi:hypothetical protein
VWGELLNVVFDLAKPIISNVASQFLSSAMGPTPGANRMVPQGPMASYGPGVPPPQAQATQGNSGQSKAPTSLNFSGGFTGSAPSGSGVGSQGPRPASTGFRTIDPRRLGGSDTEAV